MKSTYRKINKLFITLFSIILTSCSSISISNNNPTPKPTPEPTPTPKECTHKWGDFEVTKEATCTSQGEETRTCDLCGEKDVKTIPIVNHVFGNWTYKNELEHHKTCVCGEEEVEEHKWNAGTMSKEPTHFEEGETTYTCEVCDAKRTEPIPVIPHSYTIQVVDDKQHAKVCSCGHSIKENHVFDEGVTKNEPSHLSNGLIVYTCLYCKFQKDVIIPKLADDHSWSDWKYKDSNNHSRTCACGEEESEAHSWDNGVITTQPTHLSYGIKTFTCTVCKGTKTEQVAKTTQHNYGNWQQNDAETHKKVCQCGDVITEAHNFDEGAITSNPTDTTDGVITYTCQSCGFTKTTNFTEYEVINNSVFKGVSGNSVTGDPYPFSKCDVETPVFATTFSWNKYYDFVDVDLSTYSEIFFYYKETSTTYPAFYNAEKNISFYDMGSAIGDKGWQLFKLTFDSTNNWWDISSSFVNQKGFEISDLSCFKFQTGGSTPAMKLSPLFGRKCAKHTLKTHTLENSGYEVVFSMPLDLSTTSLTSYQLETIMANEITTYSNYISASEQVGDIKFNNFDNDKYDELKFYFKSLNDNDGTRKWFEIGKISDASSYAVFSSNSESWNEIRLVRNESLNFEVYANGTHKCDISSLSDLKVKVYKKQLISPLYGLVSSERALLVSNKTTSYQILYHENDARFGKHSAELLAKTLNSAIGSNIFIIKSTASKPNDADYKICVGLKMAQLANLDYSNVKGLNYKINYVGNCIYIFGDSNFGTNNGVKHFLKNTVNYEYFYKGVETFNTNVSKILIDKDNFLSNTSFLVGYDVNAETRSDAGFTWEQDFSYSIDSGLVGDGAADKYRIEGNWHNEVAIAQAKGIQLYQTSIRSNPQKHMDLTSETNAQKVAEYLNDTYYSKGKTDAMFCLMDDYSWYNKTDSQSQFSPIYYNFINMIAEKLENIVTTRISLVAVAYHQTIVCPTNWTPHSGSKVQVKVFFSPSEMIFASKPDSKYNDINVSMQDDINDTPTLSYNVYRNLVNWKTLTNQYNLPLFVYLYNSLPNYFAPLLTVEYMLDYYKLFKEMGAERLYDMGQYDNANATDWTRLKTYLKGKLTDNCDITKAEFDQLVQNFFNAYYGAASSAMKKAYDKEFSIITNPVNAVTDYDKYYGKKTDRRFPLYLRGYYYSEKITNNWYKTCRIFDGKDDDGIMDYYDQALAAVQGNQILTDRVRLDGLALRYWYWGCNNAESETGIYGGGSKFGYDNKRNEIFETIVADAKSLGVTQWGEGQDFGIDNPVKG